ncbi:MAG: hypothetical protein ABI002_00470 [Saprospiraceae bacterium]
MKILPLKEQRLAFLQVVDDLIRLGCFADTLDAAKQIGLRPGEIEELSAGLRPLKLRHYTHLFLFHNVSPDYIFQGRQPYYKLKSA